jgi:hypothetical protein
VFEETITVKKKVHVTSLILMIIGVLFALLLPIVTYPCSIISLVMSIKHRKEYITIYAIVINIIALLGALANSIAAAVITISAMM